jgi:hypothetical protein
LNREYLVRQYGVFKTATPALSFKAIISTNVHTQDTRYHFSQFDKTKYFSDLSDIVTTNEVHSKVGQGYRPEIASAWQISIHTARVFSLAEGVPESAIEVIHGFEKAC